MTSGAGRRRLGRWQGQVRMRDDFDAPLPDAELAVWHGEPADDTVRCGEPVPREAVSGTACLVPSAATRTS